MRILISLCGIGFGHASRSIAIANALMNKGYKVILSTHGSVVMKLKEKGFLVDKTFNEFVLVQEENALDIYKTFLETLENTKVLPKCVARQIKIIEKHNIDIVITDSYLSAVPAAKLKKIPVLLIVNQTNPYIILKGVFYNLPSRIFKFIFKTLIKLSNKCIIPDFPQPYTICYENIEFFNMKKKFIFSGPVVQKYPHEVRAREFKRNTILVMLGGTRVQIKLEKYLFENKKYDFIFLNSRIEKKKKNLIYKKYVKSVYPYLKSSSGIITHGGHSTIMEALVFGKPIIGMPTKNFVERENNLNGVEKHGAGIKLHEIKYINLALSKINKLQKNAKRFISLSKRYNGVKNIVKYIETI